MNDAAARWTDRAFTLSLQRAGRETLLVTLSGELGIEHVEELAACADQVCGLPVRNVRLELSGLTAVDEPGARTLAAACHCLRLTAAGCPCAGSGARSAWCWTSWAWSWTRAAAWSARRSGPLGVARRRPEPVGATHLVPGGPDAADADATDPDTGAPDARDRGPGRARAGGTGRPRIRPARDGVGLAQARRPTCPARSSAMCSAGCRGSTTGHRRRPVPRPPP